MTTAYAGKASSITINAVSQQQDTWSLALHADAIDVTNFLSGGFQENIAGIFKATATSSGPYSGNLSLNIGTTYTHTHAAGGGGPSFSATYRITDIKISADVKGALKAEITGESTGAFTISP